MLSVSPPGLRTLRFHSSMSYGSTCVEPCPSSLVVLFCFFILCCFKGDKKKKKKKDSMPSTVAAGWLNWREELQTQAHTHFWDNRFLKDFYAKNPSPRSWNHVSCPKRMCVGLENREKRAENPQGGVRDHRVGPSVCAVLERGSSGCGLSCKPHTQNGPPPRTADSRVGAGLALRSCRELRGNVFARRT